MQLVVPTIKYKNSFLEALDEYQKEHSEYTSKYNNLIKDEIDLYFSDYIDKIISESKGLNLPKGYVPQTTYWLIDNDEYIGQVSIRHKLTQQLKQVGGHIGYDIRPSKRNRGYGTKILELSIPKTRKLGIKKILVTCGETNLASKKIIEKNGGRLINSITGLKENLKKLKFWIGSD